MKTFNLSQSYPTQDIRKHTSFLTISLSACLLAAGLILLFLPEINSQSNIDILSMVAGSLMVCIAVYLLVFRGRYQAYAETGSRICKKSLTFTKDQFPHLNKYLADYCSLPVFPAEGAQLYLQVIHSKDNRYAAFQLLTYTSCLYEPVTELCCLKGEKAAAFINSLHTSHGFHH